MSGTITKDSIGGNKKGIIYNLIRGNRINPLSSLYSHALIVWFLSFRVDYGADQAAGFMNRLAKFASRYLGNRGFSIGIDDVTPSARYALTHSSLSFAARFLD